MKSLDSVIVLGCHVSGYGVIRALGMHGVKSIALTYDKGDFAYTSKYVDEKVVVPHPRTEADKFVDFLISKRTEWEGKLIIDTDDDGAVTLSKNKDELSKYYKIATAGWETLSYFIEKQKTHALAHKCNVPHPANYLVCSMDGLDEIIEELNFPYLLKPVRGHEFKGALNIKNITANTKEELISGFEMCLNADQEVMVQEIVPGPESNLYKMQGYINSKGQMTAKFFWIKLRQHPPMFGVGRVGVSQERNEEVEDMSLRLMKEANHTGFCSIEFKKDPRDGVLKLMEVNIRMPRNNVLATSSGVNFPWITYNDLILDNQLEVNNYTVNQYWIEFYADMYNILFNRKKDNIRFKDYLKPYLSKNKAFAVLSLKDPVPFFKQTMILPAILAK